MQCLGVQIKDFFEEETETQVVFTEEDYFIKEDKELNNTVKWIIPNAQKNMMEPILQIIEPGGLTYPDNPHDGEEFGYILSGSVEIHRGSDVYSAKKGESFYFTSDKKHYISSKRGCKAYMGQHTA